MFSITFSPAAREELRDLRKYISAQRSRRIASNYLRRLKTFCQELALAPHRGEHRCGIKFDQRTIGFEGRVSVIFHVSDEDRQVRIIGIRYGGRRLESNE